MRGLRIGLFPHSASIRVTVRVTVRVRIWLMASASVAHHLVSSLGSRLDVALGSKLGLGFEWGFGVQIIDLQ